MNGRKLGELCCNLQSASDRSKKLLLAHPDSPNVLSVK